MNSYMIWVWWNHSHCKPSAIYPKWAKHHAQPQRTAAQKKIVGESEADVEPTWKRRNMQNTNPTEVEPEKCSFPKKTGMNFMVFKQKTAWFAETSFQTWNLLSCGCKFSFLSLNFGACVEIMANIRVPARLQAPKVTHATPLWATEHKSKPKDLSITLLFLQSLQTWPSLSWHS